LRQIEIFPQASVSGREILFQSGGKLHEAVRVRPIWDTKRLTPIQRDEHETATRDVVVDHWGAIVVPFVVGFVLGSIFGVGNPLECQRRW
jgi:hypothetical protein